MCGAWRPRLMAAGLATIEAEAVVAAAWLHDVGYAPSVRSTGFHPVDGAAFARAEGFPAVVVSLVAYHTGAVFEARERGLLDALAKFPEPPQLLLDVLTCADMTTGPDGSRVRAEDRVSEILARYPEDNPVHHAIERSAPILLAAVARVDSVVASKGRRRSWDVRLPQVWGVAVFDVMLDPQQH
jgi:hypothetical protein